ncbi:flagellar FlbD family protein [Cellulomonas sp. zg-ZUI222]|uniref:Flagellar FlbD family protein n=1 Tax=Cellulomonas wangleii TaxID=2816956 RepID=A0ABX8D794_9CELL|nr:flagellar FlbD family protein [Cellulomonas sp. zg-ZUI22]MBO0901267.1 flagellar FlbD family protein [Cellulomonas sp. zg-ZUI22]MBO0922424.1 flagellar FlbD family protein [Cellulomonas wangleii]MBO0924865.1 flagellar FlbD family protein [Cellulomonas wangleii]QVI63031.1 flagellar FlbD family protein [Cellulomonas wangleii]
MIVVTRLSGGRFGVNPDLIQRVDSAPDTILTLVDGTKLIVRESLDEVIALIHDQRAGLLARARDIERLRPVRAVPDLVDDAEGDDPPPPVLLRQRDR